MKTFLIELDNRPDGITNQSINSYSTPAITLAQFYQRCAVATTSTQFVSVFLMVIDEQGGVIERKFIVTSELHARNSKWNNTPACMLSHFSCV